MTDIDRDTHYFDKLHPAQRAALHKPWNANDELTNVEAALVDAVQACTVDDARLPTQQIAELYSLVGSLLMTTRRVIARLEYIERDGS